MQQTFPARSGSVRVTVLRIHIIQALIVCYAFSIIYIRTLLSATTEVNIMSTQFDKKELCLIAILLDEDESRLINKRKRRFAVHNMLKKRKVEGEFWTLYKELMDDDVKHHEYFRMNKVQFEYILKKITPLTQKRNTTFKEAITPREKLAVCLRYLATGDSFKTIAFSFRLGHSTVKYIVMDVCNAIVSTMKHECIPDLTAQKWENIAQEFWEIWNFPNCVGAIDGKHIQIIAPANSGSLFFNYKKTFSVVLLALVDARYNFIAVDIGSYGKNSDGGIFQNSKLGKSLANNKLSLPKDKPLPGMQNPVPYVIVGDQAFPLKTNIMRPFPEAQTQDSLKQHFNYRLSRARRVVENAFGLLSQRFRIYNRRIQLSPDIVDTVTFTTCILHNFIGTNSKHHIEITNQTEEKHIGNLPRQGGNSSILAFHVRDTFKDFFQTEIGKVDWC